MMLTTLNSLTAALIIVLLAHRRVEMRKVNDFVRRLSLGELSPTEAALSLGGRVFELPKQANDPPYVTALFAPLGATPGAVIRKGGCCSGITRLYILTLERCEIEASQITVYVPSSRSPRRGDVAQHCLAEVRTRDQILIVDPSYGLRYGTEDGDHVSLEDLQAGRVPSFFPLPGSTARGYPDGAYYEFNYAATKTANWTKSIPRRLAYALLRATLGRRADRLRVPPLLEWPQTIMVVAILVLSALVNVAVLTSSYLAS